MKAWQAALGLMSCVVLTGCGGKAPEPKASDESATSPQAAPSAPASQTRTEPAAPPRIEVASFPPRDDCADLPGWPAFHAKLEAAIKQRDTAALTALTDPDVKLDFGGGYGTRELKKRLTDKDFLLWDELAALLPLGCSGSTNEGRGSTATMPWIIEKSPEYDDPYGAMLVLGTKVPVYSTASPASPVIGTVDWAFAMVKEYAGPDKPLTEVTLHGQKSTVFIETKRMRSILDYRIEADLRKDGWHINALIAGD